MGTYPGEYILRGLYCGTKDVLFSSLRSWANDLEKRIEQTLMEPETDVFRIEDCVIGEWGAMNVVMNIRSLEFDENYEVEILVYMPSTEVDFRKATADFVSFFSQLISKVAIDFLVFKDDDDHRSNYFRSDFFGLYRGDIFNDESAQVRCFFSRDPSTFLTFGEAQRIELPFSERKRKLYQKLGLL